MWEKCGTYSRRERAEGAVRHVLPQAGGGVGGGGGRRTRNRDHIYIYIYIYICVCVCVSMYAYLNPVRDSWRQVNASLLGAFLQLGEGVVIVGLRRNFFGRRLAPAVILILLGFIGFRAKFGGWGVLWLQACSGIYPHPEGLL